LTHQLYLSLGSNLGNKKKNLEDALSLIGDLVGHVCRVSSFIETEPWGFDSKNTFLNAACLVETALTPEQCLNITQEIERKLGRKAKSVDSYEDRPIDIDLLSYDNLNINTPELTLPHPRMHEREFVMIPLKEITH
jgi:2-amino-4-hydroxy-6-hydroxymethyldihydropteridine diphosphokinase